ncbi:MAG: Tetraacyldisaccharide 4'-kinase [Alphaproteobacteria bacterium MarineAlpha5_Bin11]|nr:MAG: Tetraacyldisaccharide 4'-kinase [Alphaproteobacteria bacterium MarineAlpha5_Bin11]PPR52186.1 MAG: Tetraacyldisaccharide 4'-kinase [Alphaproteobacteria bacterium MarineAlpha5_Bin10]|tara:strand:- start:8544 stop:9539 length:996 start_codon:yes stop_codon:yes gene_type:complete
MLRAPKFWYVRNTTIFSTIFLPTSLLFRLLSKLYILFSSKNSSTVPVICIGNLVVGGAGKTPVALKVGNLLKLAGYRPHFLTRGYAGKIKENIRVLNNHSPEEVGDESIILSSVAPTWIGSNRIKSAKLAIKNNADCIIMDDGFQNPTIKKDFSIIVIDGKQGFGNQKVLPSGPLRESINSGLKRANAVIIVGEDTFNIKKFIPSSIPCFGAKFDVSNNEKIYKGKKVTAFAGIAYPTKFFDTLENQGAKILKTFTFPDHYIYTETDLLNLVEKANKNNSILVTTKKDLIRVPESYKPLVYILEGEIKLGEEEVLKEVLINVLENFIYVKE